MQYLNAKNLYIQRIVYASVWIDYYLADKNTPCISFFFSAKMLIGFFPIFCQK